MSETTTALPFTWSSDALARDEYTVMVRTSPQGQWTRAWNSDATTTSPAVAQQWLDHFTEELADDLAEALAQLHSASSDSDRAEWEADITRFGTTEYRVFRRTISPFGPA